MTDIVERLREEGFITHIGGLPRESKLLHAAADEIERLRLESAIPRDEYAATWKALLDQIEDLDIVDWIRAYAKAYHPSDYVSPIAREVIARSDKKWLQAANEIERLRELFGNTERLRAERDEARRSCCEFAAMVDSADTVVMYVDSNRFHEIAMRYMKSRGWDCFKGEDA
jgi:hypothetical protein